MSRLGAGRRRWAVAAAVAAAGFLALAGLAPAAHAEPEPASPGVPAVPAASGPVVLLAVPGLLWSDVEAMPQLQALAARSAVGELSVKTAGGVTRCPAGLLAVSAGNRTTDPTRSPGPGCSVPAGSWASLVQANRSSTYAARLGALGNSLQAAGVSTVAVGADPVPMLANAAGAVDRQVGSLAAALQGISGRRVVIGEVDPSLYAVPTSGRPAARTSVDALVATMESELPASATLMVAGVSDLATGHAQLHAFVLNGPGWAHTELRSSAAGRAPYVQLIDIAPTILAAVGLPEPSVMVGRPMQPSGTRVPALSSYVDDNRHAVDQRALGQRMFLILGIVVMVMMVLAALPHPAGHGVARWLARLTAPAPALFFLVNALPWWRWPQPVYGLLVLAGGVVVAAASALAGRWSATAGTLVAPVFTVLVLGVDQLTGATLQLSAPLGDSPLVAGRFSGMGNLDFAAFATAAVLVGGLVGGRLSRGWGVLAAGAVALVAIVVDGAPSLGNDIGGVLTLVPAALVLVALVAGLRVTVARAVGIALAAVVVAVGVALADYSRPPDRQTHVGRFVGQVLHGGAGTEVHRKADAALASFGGTVGTVLFGFAVVLGLLCQARIRAALRTVPGATASAVAAIVLGLLGTALNDSGVTIAAIAAIVGVGALYGGGLRRGEVTPHDWDARSTPSEWPEPARPVGPADATGAATG